ncbi:unnamed protein product [Cuscuta campestris]|uniref:RIN4 pathogenic type III effector avirulence factor Avr cleavage site domain-containing protein n=1 Tax=Cuscuta campestris TaxID=132261 RepID=A0A484NSW3_9ASTE|nr:unnamed protein product [Cuscuta campestris]
MERNGRTAVPKFGGWDDKSGNSPSNYTVMFSEARANRKQQKKDFTRHSLGNEQELRAKQHQMEVESVRERLEIRDCTSSVNLWANCSCFIANKTFVAKCGITHSSARASTVHPKDCGEDAQVQSILLCERNLAAKLPSKYQFGLCLLPVKVK